MRVAMAQINPTVGDLHGNTRKIVSYIKSARGAGSDLVIFPELAVTGYPPQDLLLKKEFVSKNKDALKDMTKNAGNMTSIIGFVDSKDDVLYNAAAIFDGNKLIGTVYKTHLPTYDVFDEDRYFKSPRIGNIRPIEIKSKGISIGVEICEDLWDEEYRVKVTDLLSKRGADFIVNISA